MPWTLSLRTAHHSLWWVEGRVYGVGCVYLVGMGFLLFIGPMVPYQGGGVPKNLFFICMILEWKPTWIPFRVVLLMILMVACHTIFLMEQPKGSEQVLPRHPRFEWLCNHVLYELQLHVDGSMGVFYIYIAYVYCMYRQYLDQIYIHIYI